MALSSGSKLGPYEILSQLGAGGMGEVYRARDPRIGREVAIKVLASTFSSDSDRLRRFEQEARAAGVLNHPNIMSVYDVGDMNGSPYLVCELLEGETLRAKLQNGPISPRKATEFALQIAHGLAAAHEKGIIHRDLKPENLFVTKDGRVKILDFGLAKLTQPEITDTQHTHLPTISHQTEAGMVMGTVGYMSPEQVRGRTADHRSDIFAFGSILYEMITGKRAFHGDTPADTIGAILHKDPPDFSGMLTGISPGLERIVRHCLEKSADERFDSARDIAFALETITGTSSAPAAAPLPTEQKKKRFASVAMAAFALLLVLLPVAFFLGKRTAVPVAPPLFQPLTFQRGYISAARFAQDGHTIIYSAAFNSNPMGLYSTRIEGPESRSLAFGSAQVLAVSSKGRLMLLLNPHFIAGWMKSGTLAEVPIDGGSPREILPNAADAHWNPKSGDLLVVRSAPEWRIEFPVGKVIYRTSGWISDARFSPSGEQIAFILHPGEGDDRGSIHVIDLKGKEKVLTKERSTMQGLCWTAKGNEIWFTGGVTSRHYLYAVDLSGKERTLFESFSEITLNDVSPDGNVLITSAWRHRETRGLAPGRNQESDLSWFDYSIPMDLTPDGKTFLFQEAGETSGFQYPLYIRNMDQSPPVRLGDGEGIAISPDQKWVLAGLWGETYKLALLPIGPETVRPLNLQLIKPLSSWDTWFPDNRRLLVFGNEPGRKQRFWIYDLQTSKLQPATPEGVDVYGLPSLDGKSVLACCENDRAHFYAIGQQNSSSPASLSAQDFPIQWTTDGRSLYVAKEIENPLKVYVVDLQTGQRTLWKELAPSDTAGVLGVDNLHMTPDGSAYIYSYRRVLATLFLLKGLK